MAETAESVRGPSFWTEEVKIIVADTLKVLKKQGSSPLRRQVLNSLVEFAKIMQALYK